MPSRTVRIEVFALLALCVAWSPASAQAACDASIFSDGFELGDTSRWSNSAAPPRGNGSWLFSIDFDGSTRAFALELVQRADGSLVGYLLGGTGYRNFVTGAVSGSSVAFDLEMLHPLATRTITLTGTLDRGIMALTASGGVAPQAVTAVRLGCDLVEQQLLAAELTGGPEPLHVREVAVVLDGQGSFVAGGFVGVDDCDLWACDGGLTSFSDVADVLTIGLETDGGCSVGSSLTATWDAGSGIYQGSYTFHDCAGTTSGSGGAAYDMATTNRAARDALAGRVEIADRLEADVPILAPLDAFADGYLSFGKDEPAIRVELDAEIAAYDDLEVELVRARALVTATHPRTLPDLIRPYGWTIDERKSGVPVAGGPDPVTYRDTGTRPLIDDYGLLGFDGDRVEIVGNQVPALDLPFDYTIPPGGSRLEAATADALPVYVSLGPYGAHFSPLTGDPSGEAKANFIGFLVAGDSEMEELVGDGDGVREPGETWGYPIGGDPSGNRVRNRRPVYRAPLAGGVEALIYDQGPTGNYFDDEPQWRVELAQPGELHLAFGHVGAIAAPLAALVLAATGIDPATFAGPAGTDLLAGHPPISVPAGFELALPQIVADPVPGFPDYVGSSGFLHYPWTQIEFQIPYQLPGPGNLGADFCIYRFLAATRRAELQATMDLDMLDPGSQRYRDGPFWRRWQWSTQGGLCQAESLLPRDYSSLYTRLGGWYERTEAGTTADELFSFIPIDRVAAAYDAANYDSPAVDHLAIRFLWPGPYSWLMPDGTTATVFQATGEVVERDAGAMLVKWRELNATNPFVYQRVAYLLDGAGLKAKWGNLAATPGGALQPTLLPGDPCNDTDTLCYDHSLGGWPPS